MDELRDLSQVEDRKIRIVAFVQARLGSERLPQKTIFEINGKPLIDYLIDRLNMSLGLAGIVICMPVADQGSELDRICMKRHLPIWYGSENDVASRFLGALQVHRCDAFVRICADSPVMDPILIDKVIQLYIGRPKGKAVASNVGCGYPSGQQIEVIDSEFYSDVCHELIDREHVTSEFYWKYRDKVLLMPALRDRWEKMSVDTFDDFERISELISGMFVEHWKIGWYECHERLEKISRSRLHA